MSLKRRYRKLCVQLSHIPVVGWMAKRLAMLGMPPHHGLWPLASMALKGFSVPTARISHERLMQGQHCFLGDQTLIFGEMDSGEIQLGDGVHLHQRTTLQTGQKGSIRIGSGTHIQPDCLLSGYKGDITIGINVEIAPRCAIYSYNHQFVAGRPIREQPITSGGGVIIEDDVWLGVGVILLDGSRIGTGAVIAAGSVVNSTIPANGIAAGNPARLIGMRS